MAERTESSGALRFRQPATVDAKGRVVLQQQFRVKFADTVWVMIEDGGLTVMNAEQFEMLAQHVMRQTAFNSPDTAHRFFDKGLREMRRKFFANATELSFDGQNRLTIPKPMRDAVNMPLETAVVWLAEEDFVTLRRADVVAAEDANDCVQWAGAAGNKAVTAAPPNSPVAPNLGSGGEG
jgi:DNA-binding transcriptional regulator/RsmH inhibitor MraZ